MFIHQVELRELRMRLVHPFETSFGTTRERRIVIVKVREKPSDGEPVTLDEGTVAVGVEKNS